MCLNFRMERRKWPNHVRNRIFDIRANGVGVDGLWAQNFVGFFWFGSSLSILDVLLVNK